MVELSVLGRPALKGDGQEELDVLVGRPKLFGLLTHLALPIPGTFHQRDTLLARFWPDLNQEKAQAALRKALYHIRHSLGGNDSLLKRGDGLIGVNPEHLRCDVAEFEKAVENGELEKAVDLYRGGPVGRVLPRERKRLRAVDGRRTRSAQRHRGRNVVVPR